MPATRSDGSLASLMLVQRLVESAADPLSAKEYFALLERVPNPEAMLGQTAATLAAELGIDPNLAARVATRLEVPAVFAEALESMEESGLTVLTAVDEDYPPSLRSRLRTPPPALYLSGDDLKDRRDGRVPLYSTDVTTAGSAATHPFTLHANAAVAQALEILRRTLDEQSARDVEDRLDPRADHGHRGATQFG